MPRYNWNPDPARVVLFDLETQSPKSLPKVGTRSYLADPHTRLMSLVALAPGRRIVVWVPAGRMPDCELAAGDVWPKGFDASAYTVAIYRQERFPAELLELVADHVWVAHNAAGFDAPAWPKLIGGDQPVFFDTVPAARAAGLPGGLDRLGHVFLGRGKDSGKEALRLLYTAKVKPGGEVVYNLGTPPLWKKVLQYNVADVLLLERVFAEVADYGEADVMAVNSTINRRGVAFDRPLLHNLNRLWVELQKGAAENVAELTDNELGEVNIRSVPQVKGWLSRLGLHVDTLNRKELERLYADPAEYFGEVPDGVDLGKVVEVLRQRQIATRISTGKITRILEMGDEDGRVRDWCNYWGAHTGRFSARGFQPHNFAKGVGDSRDIPKGEPGVIETLIRRFESAGRLTLDDLREQLPRCDASNGPPGLDDLLSSLLRPVFWGGEDGLGIIDYASIEARCIAWLAGQDDLVELFANGADVYCDMASKIFGRPVTKTDDAQRQIGKITVLGCGYGMGAAKFAMFCQLMRINLAAVGTTAEACIDAYRDAYPAIAGERKGDSQFRAGGVWKAYERAALAVLRGRPPVEAGRCLFAKKGDHLVIVLPSGRELTYRCARIEKKVPRYAVLLGLDVGPKDSIVYAHPHGYDGDLYGGLLAENISQAVCRDIMATSLVRAEAAGIPIVLHVHDEDVCQGRQHLRRLAELMTEPPEWAEGFPIEAEGFSSPRYVKKAFLGSEKVHARNGVLL